MGNNLPKAAAKEDWKTVRKLIKKGGDINLLDDRGYSALHYAAKSGETNIVMKLFWKGASLDLLSSSGRACEVTALHFAAMKGHTATVRELIRIGASIDVVDTVGRTALIFAVENNRVEVVKVLIASGANVNHPDANQWTALHAVAKCGFTEILSELLKCKNVNIHCKNNQQLTPLDVALALDTTQVIDILCKYESNISAPKTKTTMSLSTSGMC